MRLKCSRTTPMVEPQRVKLVCSSGWHQGPSPTNRSGTQRRGLSCLLRVN
jgi:hypothetical protein